MTLAFPDLKTLRSYFPYLPADAAEDNLRSEYERRKLVEIPRFQLTENEWHALLRGDFSVVDDKGNKEACYALCYASGYVAPLKLIKQAPYLQLAFTLAVNNNWQDGVQHLLAKGCVPSDIIASTIKTTNENGQGAIAVLLIEHQQRQQEDKIQARSRSKSLNGKKK